MQRRLLLACIGQTVTPPTGEKLASAIKDGRSALAVASIGIDRTNEPGRDGWHEKRHGVSLRMRPDRPQHAE